jgi:glyoxylase-like metal-dependent hydrolase (beta-lactamase superfamily II)
MPDYEHFLAHRPSVTGFFDSVTHTISYVIADEKTKRCAIVDSVLDYEPHGATISFESADKLIEYVRTNGYGVDWILETHVHADHLSAAPYLKEKLGGKIAIGERILEVQNVFGKVFNEGTEFERDGSQFDRLFKDGDTFSIGSIPARVMYTPGHTPADVTYVIGDAVFPGDTLFMPDYGTARVDFPGGSAEDMHASARKLFHLPEQMRMFMCHDYLPDGRSEYQYETTVAEQKRSNIHLGAHTTAATFSALRKERDATLGMPHLIIPALQVNMRAGNFPQNKETGAVFLKTPVDSVFSKKRVVNNQS